MTRTGHALLIASSLMLLQPAGAAIYTCVDSAGRRITSDRPIIECIDREQRLLNPSGTVREVMPPSLTDAERAAADEKSKREVLERQRAVEDRNRARALVMRYPNQAALDKDRANSLAPIDEVIATARQRVAALETERRRLLTEGGASPRALEQNEQERKSQERFVADKSAEKELIRLRFADMQRRLEAAWAQQPSTAAASR